MAKLWTRGGVDLAINTKKGALVLQRGEDYQPEEAREVAEAAIAAAKDAKCGIDRYAVYIPDLKVAKDAKTISPAAVAGALKKHDNVVLMANKFGQPFLLIAKADGNKPKAEREVTIHKVARK